MTQGTEKKPYIPVETTFLLAIYKHLLKTLAWAVFWFSVAGGAGASLAASGGFDSGTMLVSFFAWGTFAAAISFALRRPPF